MKKQGLTLNLSLQQVLFGFLSVILVVNLTLLKFAIDTSNKVSALEVLVATKADKSEIVDEERVREIANQEAVDIISELLEKKDKK